MLLLDIISLIKTSDSTAAWKSHVSMAHVFNEFRIGRLLSKRVPARIFKVTYKVRVASLIWKTFVKQIVDTKTIEVTYMHSFKCFFNFLSN